MAACVHLSQYSVLVARQSALTLIIILVVSTGHVGAINLAQCGNGLADQQAKEWNKTHAEPPPQFNLTYGQCLAECSSGMGNIEWARFSETFSSWLLPWIALMFQIPFGAEGELYTFSGS